LPQIQIAFPVQTNAVFAAIPDKIVQALHQRGWEFHTNVGVPFARLMCSWDTSEQDVDAFAADLRELCDTTKPE
jgi:threonine aldolase